MTGEPLATYERRSFEILVADEGTMIWASVITVRTKTINTPRSARCLFIRAGKASSVESALEKLLQVTMVMLAQKKNWFYVADDATWTPIGGDEGSGYYSTYPYPAS